MQPWRFEIPIDHQHTFGSIHLALGENTRRIGERHRSSRSSFVGVKRNDLGSRWVKHPCLPYAETNSPVRPTNGTTTSTIFFSRTVATKSWALVILGKRYSSQLCWIWFSTSSRSSHLS